MAHALEMRFDSNQLSRSEDPTHADWVKTDVTATGSLADPLDGTAAWSLGSDGTGGTDSAYQEWTTNASAVRYSVEFYCRAGNGDAASDSLSFGLYDQTATSFPNQTTRILSGPGSMEDTSGSQRIASLEENDWTRVQLSLDGAATATNNLRFYLYPGGDDVTSSTAVIDIFRPTLQEYPHDSRLVASTTAITTTWTAVTSDLLARSPVRWSHGIFNQAPDGLLARPGMMTFALDNSERNSATTAGYYSPFHGSVRSGFRHGIKVRLKVDPGGGAARYVFNGRLKSILPEPGPAGMRRTLCVVQDWIGELADLSSVSLELAEDQRPEQLIASLVDLVASPPAAVNYDTGIDTFEVAFDDLGENPMAMAVAQGILQSTGTGRLFIYGDATNGEVLTFKNRHSDFLGSSAATITDSKYRASTSSMLVPSTLDRVFNDVDVEYPPRTVETTAASVLISFDTPVLTSASGQVEYLFATSDVATTGWSSTPLWSKIDDWINASDYAQSDPLSSSNTTEEFECHLGNPSIDPTGLSASGFELDGSAGRFLPGRVTVTLRLYEGASLVAQQSETDGILPLSLTQSEFDSISDWTDLRVKVLCTWVSGTGPFIRVNSIRMRVPQPSIPTTMVVQQDYSDPTGAAEFTSAKDMIQPVANTDFTASENEDGSGTDLTDFIANAAAYDAVGGTFTLSNSGLVDAWVRGPGTDDGMQARGAAIRRFAPVTLSSEDKVSIDKHGRRQLATPFRMPYQSSANVAQAMANLILDKYKDVDAIPLKIQLNVDSATVRTYLGNDVGDLATISETQTGVSSQLCVILGVEGVLLDGTVNLSWTLGAVDESSVFVIDTSSLDGSDVVAHT